MKLTDMMNYPLKELVEQCNITKVQPISDDNGNIKKFIVEYEPHDESGKCDNMNLEVINMETGDLSDPSK